MPILEPLPASIRCIAVIGTTGSGKTTLAARLAHRLHVPHVELDALHWEPDWVEAPDDVLRQRVEAATRGPAWVADGNYRSVRNILWPRAQALVWLDYPLAVILWRLWWRTWKRILTRERLWGANVERLGPQFFSRESLFLWVLQTFPRRRWELPQQIALPEHRHLKIFRLTSITQAEAWLDAIN